MGTRMFSMDYKKIEGLQFRDVVGKGNLTVFESSNISETGMATPIKIGVHAQYIDLYLHDFFEPILND